MKNNVILIKQKCNLDDHHEDKNGCNKWVTKINKLKSKLKSNIVKIQGKKNIKKKTSICIAMTNYYASDIQTSKQ